MTPYEVGPSFLTCSRLGEISVSQTCLAMDLKLFKSWKTHSKRPQKQLQGDHSRFPCDMLAPFLSNEVTLFIGKHFQCMHTVVV